MISSADLQRLAHLKTRDDAKKKSFRIAKNHCQNVDASAQLLSVWTHVLTAA